MFMKENTRETCHLSVNFAQRNFQKKAQELPMKEFIPVKNRFNANFVKRLLVNQVAEIYMKSYIQEKILSSANFAEIALLQIKKSRP